MSDKKVAAYIMNHISLFDSFLSAFYHWGSIVTDETTRNMPIIGRNALCVNALFLDKKDPERSLQMIKERMELV